MTPSADAKPDSKVKNIPTRYALIARSQKLLKEIDDYFEDADRWGVSVAESDPDGMLQGMRKGLIDLLIRKGKIKP